MFVLGDRVILTKGTCKGVTGTVSEYEYHGNSDEVEVVFDEQFTVRCGDLSYTLDRYITTVDEVALLTDLSEAIYE